MKAIKPISDLKTIIRVPGSKSITHRAVIAAALAGGESRLRDFLECEDTLYTINTLKELGVDISVNGNELKVMGCGGEFAPVPYKKELYLGNSGTSFRLLLSVVALGRGEFFMTGIDRMLERPIWPLVTAVNKLGGSVSCVTRNNYPPVLVRADGIRGGKVDIQGNQSSQFLSSLLLTGPYSENGVEIKVSGDLVSKPYVDMTIDVMAQFGVPIERDGYTYFKIQANRKYRHGNISIQGDASSASYFWAAAAVTGGTVITENIQPFNTRQGDMALLDIMKEMGCLVEKESDRVIVHGGRLSGIDVDMSSMPDMVPTLAAMALFADGKTIIRNVPHLRHKESDRLQAVAFEWGRMGARVKELEDGLIIHGGKKLSGGVMDPHNDHRIAMSLAVAGLRVPGLTIKDKTCVKKSFPRFWELWDTLTL